MCASVQQCKNAAFLREVANRKHAFEQGHQVKEKPGEASQELTTG